jgi:hypothetical protein
MLLTVALLGLGCGVAETAVFIVAITNTWPVEGDPGRVYTLGAKTSDCKSSEEFEGREDVTDDQGHVHEASVQGSFNVPFVEFTVQRTAQGAPCADCTSCACVHFRGHFSDPNSMFVSAGSEQYHLQGGGQCAHPP